VRDRSDYYRGATKGGQASRSNGEVDRVKESAANGGYRFPILDNTFSLLIAMNELLLKFVVVGGNCGENKSQNSKKTN
jgi:hypothetical protein